jgi:hypothetical protein
MIILYQNSSLKTYQNIAITIFKSYDLNNKDYGRFIPLIAQFGLDLVISNILLDQNVFYLCPVYICSYLLFQYEYN